MRVLIAPGAFKECLSAVAVAEALAEGWRRARPKDEIRLLPMADGGEGTVDAMIAASGGQRIPLRVTGPLGDPVEAAYGLLRDGETAVIEMALAAGLALVPRGLRDPRSSTTRGVGELIAHALDSGARRLVVGIGGSATNDGGAGMAQALGFRLLDASGGDLPGGGAALASLSRIDTRGAHPAIADCTVRVACDVDNPLCGPRGASAVYGPQKGASRRDLDELDGALRHYGAVVEQALGIPVLELPGAGAAGGLGAGLAAFLDARLEPGLALIAEACGLASQAAATDLVLTGEGRLDRQSAHGKTPFGVASYAKSANVPVIAVAGSVETGLDTRDFQSVHALCAPGMTPEESIRRAPELLASAAARIAAEWGAMAQPKAGQ